MRVEQNVNSVQQFSAINSFKSNRVLKPIDENEGLKTAEETSAGTKAAPKSILEKVDTADIRKCAEFVGEYNITDEDIKYGLLYGRSVIAEYLC